MKPNRFIAKIIVFGCLALGLSLASANLARAQNSPAGWWLDQSQRAGILIAPCGADLCGRIAWLRVPLNSAGQPKTDIHNNNPALQTRPLCGLQMIGGFTPDAPGTWSGGWIYDAENGNTYKSTMHLTAGGRLRVRGYIGLPLFGKSQIWTRPHTALQNCTGK